MKTALRFLLLSLLALVVTAAVATYLVVKLALAPGTGEWPARVKVGPLTFDVGVPTALRLVTSSWFAPWIDGREIDTRYGPLRFGWNAQAATFGLRCAPCAFPVPALGEAPVRFERVNVTVRRDGGALHGIVEAAPPDATPDTTLRARWDGRLTQRALQLDIEATEAPIARWFAVLAPGLPEHGRARIDGTLALRAHVELPAQSFTLHPRLSGFEVDGLGTEALLDARTACGPPARLAANSWLARAVIAAEDQRFFTHPGYDLAEITASLAANQAAGRVERGASTLTQQLARLLVTGSERSAERKLRELLYAVEMERTLGKARILQLYLDNAPWGDGLCGAEAAARRYFRRSARVLDPAQAVWLAAMLTQPDAALQKWRQDGQIDHARARRVAEAVRGIHRAQRESLLRRVDEARLPPPP